MNPVATVQAVIERTALAWGLARPQANRMDRFEMVALAYAQGAGSEPNELTDDDQIFELVV